MVEHQEFQIPQQLRELAEKSVEQARLAYGQFLDGMAEACVHGRQYRQP